MNDLDQQFDLITQAPKRYNPGISVFFNLLTLLTIACSPVIVIGVWRFFL